MICFYIRLYIELTARAIESTLILRSIQLMISIFLFNWLK